MDTQTLNNKIRWSLLLNIAYAGLELLAGFSSSSLALISDATHNLTDSATLLISFFAQKISLKQPNQEHTFGYGRARILAALVNSLIMLGLAATIFYSAYSRWHNPRTIDGRLVAIIAGVGILINGTVASMLRKHKNDLNIKTAFLNMSLDVVTSIATLAGGAVIYFTHFDRIDALISIFIGIIMVIGCIMIINQAVHIILEGAPLDIDPQKVVDDLKSFSGVLSVDDFHLWTIASGRPALSCHLMISRASPGDVLDLTKRVKQMLSEKYDIKQTAIEVGAEHAPEHEH